MTDHEENPFLIRARFERQLTEMGDTITKLEQEKAGLIANNVKSNVMSKKSKIGEERRKRLIDLEKQLADLKK